MAKKATPKKESSKTKLVLFVQQPISLKLSYSEGKKYTLKTELAESLIDQGFCIEVEK